MQDNSDDDLRPEYDLSALRGLSRGKYYESYRQHLRTVRLADDVAAAFETEEAVNEALRTYLREHPAESPANDG